MANAPASPLPASTGHFRPPVIPRASAFPEGEILPLEHHIEGLLGRGIRGPVNLFGPAGGGKSTALAYVAARFAADQVMVLDEVPWREVLDAGRERLVLFTSRIRQVAAPVAFELAPWREDDVIEYLLHAHRDACTSIMNRVRAARDHEVLQGLPQLWAIVLEEFAEHDALQEIRPALRHYLNSQFETVRTDAADYCMDVALAHGANGAIPPVPAALRPDLLRHVPLVYLLAGEALAADIAQGNLEDLHRRLPRAILHETAHLLKGENDTFDTLATAAQKNAKIQSAAISLLLEIDSAWCPVFRVFNLKGAHLPGAKWQKVNLKGATLSDANFSYADLSGAQLTGCLAFQTNFSHAKLADANLNNMHAFGADFVAADLSAVRAVSSVFDHANLQKAKLVQADLENANLTHANLAGCRCVSASLKMAILHYTGIENADFTSADFRGAKFLKVAFRDAVLHGARFRKATLRACDLEGVHFPAADFGRANLAGSYFTASVMPGADFRRAILCNCGLAEVEWENADLRGADLTNASFHMGSSRSGLVHSTLASEGTRTGFYTDDYNDQDFKAPEEIRKANLTGCDLRGAKVEGADFYLVDLRRAKYTPDQMRHFARCGAILKSRA